jgi:hypothetical protein
MGDGNRSFPVGAEGKLGGGIKCVAINAIANRNGGNYLVPLVLSIISINLLWQLMKSR